MKHIIRLSLLLLLPSHSLFASTPTLGNGGVDAIAFVKMFIGLLFTIAIIFLLAWLSRKSKLITSLHAEYQIKTLATQSLSSREKLCLVEVGDKQILIGLAPGSVSKIHVFDEPISAIPAPVHEGSPRDFATQFKQALGIQTREQRD